MIDKLDDQFAPPPLVARITGLPASAVASLASPLCASYLESRRDLQRQLASARSELIHLIFGLLTGLDARSRRFMLSIKRNCFNGREIGRHERAPEWPELRRLSGGLADQIVALESQVRELDRSFEETYRRERDRERSHLVDLLADVRFVRGIALGSPELVGKSRELKGRSFDEHGRQGRKLEESLFRFVTRAAAKLSPYSTLTPIALCRVCAGPAGLRFVGGERRERSVVRVNRSLLDQCCAILLQHPSVRGDCLVSVNDTLEKSEPNRYRCLRPARWTFDPSSGSLRFVSASQVKADLASPASRALFDRLAHGPVTYRELSEAAGRQEVPAAVEELISLGFLVLLPPWCTHEPHLELQIFGYLRELPTDPDLQPLVHALDLLIRGEAGYLDAPRPEEASQALRTAVEALLASMARACCGGREVAYATGDRHFLYEDVFLLGGSDDAAQVEISSRTVQELVAVGEVLSRFTGLYSHRQDFLHGLAAIWADRWPARCEIGVLELFLELKDYWKSYVAFDRKHRHLLFSSFNPLELDSIGELDRLRSTLYRRVQEQLREDPSGWLLPRESFEELVGSIPARYAPLVGPCLFAQPATPQADLWVLNRLFEGTGRYGSRFYAVLEEPVRSRCLSAFEARSKLRDGAGEIHLLDLMCSQGTTSNLRLPQTHKILELPGERLDLPAQRRVLLRDLRVRADLAEGRFEVVDPAGRRYLPVHLSSVTHHYLPVILRFLSMFGPYETRQVIPRPKAEPAGDGVAFFDRLTCGNLVLRRRRWEIEGQRIGEETSRSGDAEAFRKIDAWRVARGLPERVFFYEPMDAPQGLEVFKPQYLDFTSPAAVAVFRGILRSGPLRLIFEEPLPPHTSFPSDSAGERWGLELQVDSLCLKGEELLRHRTSS